MGSHGETLYVIIPCLNEEGSIDAVADEVLTHAPSLPVDLKLLMIDDGSTDGTRRRMEAICERHSNCELIVNEQNLGIGRSVMNAYDRIPDGSWVTGLPGDGELVFAASIDNLLAARKNFDLVLGYLHNPVIRTLGRRMASFAFTKVTSTLYGFPWRYLNGLKLYRVEVFRGIEVVSGGHAYVAELLAKAMLRRPGLRITQAPFVSRGRGQGQSKAIAPKSVVRAVREVYAGSRSVAAYRTDVLRGQDNDR